VSLKAAGTCVIDANQAGNSTYASAPQVQQKIVIGKGSQTITFTSTPPTSPTVGGGYTVTATASSGLTVSFSIDGSSTARACSIKGATVSFKAAGTCVIDANQAGNSTYASAPQIQQKITVTSISRRRPAVF
jgi:hypothetical protein